MNLPRKAKHWHQEISDALLQAKALCIAEQGSFNKRAKEGMYKYAPMFAMKNRGLTDAVAKESVMRYCAQLRAYDFAADDEAKNNYEINFQLSYLDAHVCMQLISEQRHDQIMAAIADMPMVLSSDE